MKFEINFIISYLLVLLLECNKIEEIYFRKIMRNKLRKILQ